MHNSYEGLDRPGGFNSSGLLAPLKERNFRLLWTGMTVSLLGDGISLLTLAWAAYEITDSPIGLSMVMLAMTIPHVALLLFGGVASDRLQRRYVMLASDLVRGVVVGTIGFMALADALTIPRLAALAALYGAGSAFFGPSFDAIVPEIVPASQLGQANSLDQLVKPLALRMAGPAVGGWLIAIGGTGVAFLVDAATFGVSAIALMLSADAQESQARERASVLTEMKVGLTYVRSEVWLWGTFGAAAIAYLLFMGPVEVLLPHIVKVELGGSAGALGLVFAFGGLGSVGAAIWVGRHGLPRRIVTLIYVCWTLSTLAIAGYGLGESHVATHHPVHRVQLARVGRHHWVDDAQAAPRALRTPGEGFKPRLADLHRPRAPFVRANRAGCGDVRRAHDAHRSRRSRCARDHGCLLPPRYASTGAPRGSIRTG